MGLTGTYTEQELIAALQAGDEQAFSYLYDHYSGSLYSIILQIVKIPETANDVLQEVFINIWRKIATYDPVKGRLFTWMLNISRNASIDMLRSKSYQNSLKNQEITDTVYGTEQVNPNFSRQYRPWPVSGKTSARAAGFNRTCLF